ncbi:glucose-1-phosphate thymidylyltransferase RfbA [Streptomyces spiramenti]|uniref:Glucose-1-phosphate thymidylyltransferase n=1 Tax=Streptomyces spiramenti TaxID=2720606 RepID=A0ABX1AKB4_9ACTN|nr:glucose-1-phosphate thymidylyltransferase RfbA [Streptomyces spiramenti]NJP64827.1 glucose-1-phosphate thymidylyltransferase RfbA [Streptomyces spiramenti]
MKGIILAGGSGSRLSPVTIAVSKQLLPVGEKPMIYYPLSVLMLGGIRDVLIISKPQDIPQFRRVLGDGTHLGMNFAYAEQAEPNGLAEAFIIGSEHIGDDSVALVLGDNIFHGNRFQAVMEENTRDIDGCVLFGYSVKDPERYGVGETDADGRLISLEEKPSRPRTNRAVTGLYLYDNDVVDIAKNVRPSERGELEITDVNRVYLERGNAKMVDLGRGFAWLDTGTPESLLQASLYVRTLEERQGVRIACLEEIALRMGFISAEDCHRLGEELGNCAYGAYVRDIAREFTDESPDDGNAAVDPAVPLSAASHPAA